MKISEIQVLKVARDTYVAKGETEGKMLATCVDGRTDGKPMVPQFYAVPLSDELIKKHGGIEKLTGKLLTVHCDRPAREPYDGAPLKVIGEVIEVR